MSWQFLVGLSVVLYSINGLLHRTIMKDESSDAYVQAVAFTGLSGVFFLIILIFRGGFQPLPSWNQLPLFLLVAFLSSMGMICTFKGFKLIGASEHTILLTSSRLWLILGAVLFLQESLTFTKLLGTIAVLFGVLVAEWEKKSFVLNKGAVFVLLAAFFFATSETISFSIIRNYDVLSYMLYGSVFVTSILIILKPKIIEKMSFYFKPKRALNIITTSVSDASANIFGHTAYQIGRNALQIGPIMSTQTLLTVLLAIVVLKERDRMFQKIVGSLITVIGVILLL